MVAVVVSHPIRRLQFVRSSSGSESMHPHIHRPVIVSARCTQSGGSKRSALTTPTATVSSQPRSCPAADLLIALLFGLNASVTSPLTLTKIHKVYHKTDSHSVASKQLGMSSYENVTPITRPARTLGAATSGYQTLAFLFKRLLF